MTDNELIAILKTKFGAIKRGNGNWVRVRCPTCTPRDAAKMKRGIHLRSLVTNCFICQKPLVWSQIFGNTPISPSTDGPCEIIEHPQARSWPCTSVVPVSALPEDHPAVKFLAKDHLTNRLTLWTDYRVGYITKDAAIDIWFDKGPGVPRTSVNTADSLVFPVTFNEKFVGWQIRFIPGTPHGDRMSKMKYLHVFPKGNYLYNYDTAKNYSSVVLVEGIKKAWKFPNAVASLGKGISQQQIQLLQNWDEIILMYDGDTKTQAQAEILRDRIALNKKCININPAKYGFASPDEMTHDEACRIAYQEWKLAYG